MPIRKHFTIENIKKATNYAARDGGFIALIGYVGEQIGEHVPRVVSGTAQGASIITEYGFPLTVKREVAGAVSQGTGKVIEEVVPGAVNNAFANAFIIGTSIVLSCEGIKYAWMRYKGRQAKKTLEKELSRR